MTPTRAWFERILSQMGSDVVFHRESSADGTACPCLNHGFRDPAWHEANPEEPVCNEQGYLVDAVEFVVKASIQPAFTGMSRHGQRSDALLGEVQRDDMLGIFPIAWGGNTLGFDNWSDAGNDYIGYNGKRYVVASADLVPDVDGTPHHYETGLRLVKLERPS